MSEAVEAMEKLDYVSERKETDNVVSNEFVPVVKYAFTTLKRGVEKNWILVSDLEEAIDIVPESMEAFTREHVDSLKPAIDEIKKDYNDLKVMQMCNDEYEPKVKAA